MKTNRTLWIFFFLAAASILLAWNIHRIPFFEPDEGRYADIAQTMVQTGDWLIPRVNHVKHFHKPPLSSWLVAASFVLWGPSEWSARLPGIVLSLILLFGMIRLGKFLFDFETGLNAAWILLTSPLYLVTSKLVTTDIVLTFFVFTAMASLAHLFFGGRRPVLAFYGAALSSGLGMLTKGPVAWMIALLPAVLFAFWKKKKLRIAARHWFFAGFLFLVISLGWYGFLLLQNINAAPYFLKVQLLGRIAGGSVGHAHPFYYFLIILPLGFLPWFLFLPFALSSGLGKEAGSEARDKLQFLVLWFLIPLIFFSFFRTKLATYIVPLFPPLAMLVAYLWKNLELQKIKPSRSLTLTALAFSVGEALFATGGLVFILIKPFFVAGIPREAIAFAALFCLAASAWLVQMAWVQNFRLLFRSQTAALFFLALFGYSVLPSLHFKNTKVFAQKIMELKKPGDVVLMYDRYFPNLPFYFKERVITVGVEAEKLMESPENLKDFVFERHQEIDRFMKGRERVLGLTDEKRLKEARSQTSATFYRLMSEQGLVLFSNHPES